MNRVELRHDQDQQQAAPHYLHVEHANGRVIGLSISSPGRYVGSEVGDLLRALSTAANEVIAEIGGRE